MISNKKAIQSHILIILIGSFIMSILISFVIDSIFIPDNQNCQNINFEISKKKKTDTGASFFIKNTKNTKIDFEINGNQNYPSILSNEEIEFKIRTKNETIEIIPLYIDPIQKEVFKCNGKKETINIATLI